MSESSDFRDALGITQEDAAMLLRVSRSQFSLFELGKRSLPTKAMVEYIAMWSYVQEQQNTMSNHIHSSKVKDEGLKLFIEAQLAEALYKQKFLQKKLAATEEKFKKAQAALILVDYLKSKVKPNHKNLIQVIEINARKKLKKHGVLAQTKLQLELKSIMFYYRELLEFQNIELF